MSGLRPRVFYPYGNLSIELEPEEGEPMTGEPMTEEALQQIRVSRDTLAAHPDGRMLIARYVRHVDALLAEVERLRAREAAAMEIVQAVAKDATIIETKPGVTWCAACLFVWGPDSHAVEDEMHADDCPVTKARAILAPDGEIIEE